MGRRPSTRIVIIQLIEQYNENAILLKKTKEYSYYYIPLLHLEIKILKRNTLLNWITKYVNYRHNQFGITDEIQTDKVKKTIYERL